MIIVMTYMGLNSDCDEVLPLPSYMVLTHTGKPFLSIKMDRMKSLISAWTRDFHSRSMCNNYPVKSI